jgi:hypothetical protein
MSFVSPTAGSIDLGGGQFGGDRVVDERSECGCGSANGRSGSGGC